MAQTVSNNPLGNQELTPLESIAVNALAGLNITTSAVNTTNAVSTGEVPINSSAVTYSVNSPVIHTSTSWTWGGVSYTPARTGAIMSAHAATPDRQPAAMPHLPPSPPRGPLATLRTGAPIAASPGAPYAVPPGAPYASADIRRRRPAPVRPKLAFDAAPATFRKFQMDWAIFKHLACIDEGDSNIELYSCCDEKLQSALYTAYPHFLTMREDSMLHHLNALINRTRNRPATRKYLQTVVQQPGEGMTDYSTRVLQAANDCHFVCHACHADLTDEHARDQLMIGLSDATLQKEIMCRDRACPPTPTSSATAPRTTRPRLTCRRYVWMAAWRLQRAPTRRPAHAAPRATRAPPRATATRKGGPRGPPVGAAAPRHLTSGQRSVPPGANRVAPASSSTTSKPCVYRRRTAAPHTFHGTLTAPRSSPTPHGPCSTSRPTSD